MDKKVDRKNKSAKKRNIEAIYDLAPLQKGMLFESLKSPNSGVFITQPVVILKGVINIDSLEMAWRDVINHFPILRTVFSYENREKPYQIVLRSVNFSIISYDWRSLNEDSKKQQLKKLLKERRLQGFNFNQAPLMSVVLVQFSEDEYRLVWTHHHILLDGWSVGRVMNSLVVAYDAREKNTTPNLTQTESYESYINWLSSRDIKQDEKFWRHYLAGFEAKNVLPRFGMDTRQTGENYGYVEYGLSAQLTQRLVRRAREQRVTQNTLVQAAWALLLSRYTNTTDVVFGAVSSGRPAELKGVETIVGLLINTVPVRIKLSHKHIIKEILESLQAANGQLREHEHVSLSDIQH